MSLPVNLEVGGVAGGAAAIVTAGVGMLLEVDAVTISALFAGLLALVAAIGGMVIQIITALNAKKEIIKQTDHIIDLTNSSATAAQVEIKELRSEIKVLTDSALARSERQTDAAVAKADAAQLAAGPIASNEEVHVATRTERK